jgi:hypothetical protein
MSTVKRDESGKVASSPDAEDAKKLRPLDGDNNGSANIPPAARDILACATCVRSTTNAYRVSLRSKGDINTPAPPSVQRRRHRNAAGPASKATPGRERKRELVEAQSRDNERAEVIAAGDITAPDVSVKRLAATSWGGPSSIDKKNADKDRQAHSQLRSLACLVTASWPFSVSPSRRSSRSRS